MLTCLRERRRVGRLGLQKCVVAEVFPPPNFHGHVLSPPPPCVTRVLLKTTNPRLLNFGSCQLNSFLMTRNKTGGDGSNMLVQFFVTKYHSWGPKVQSKCTQIQIVGLFCNSRSFVRGINFIKTAPAIKTLLSRRSQD